MHLYIFIQPQLMIIMIMMMMTILLMLLISSWETVSYNLIQWEASVWIEVDSLMQKPVAYGPYRVYMFIRERWYRYHAHLCIQLLVRYGCIEPAVYRVLSKYYLVCAHPLFRLFIPRYMQFAHSTTRASKGASIRSHVKQNTTMNRQMNITSTTFHTINVIQLPMTNVL